MTATSSGHTTEPAARPEGLVKRHGGVIAVAGVDPEIADGAFSWRPRSRSTWRSA